MKITYGTIDNRIDVTTICKEKLLLNNIITIPRGDNNRTNYFTDPVFGYLKTVFITMEDNSNEFACEYKNMCIINLTDKTIHIINIDEEVEKIHSKLSIKYGDLTHEYSEQCMSFMYLTGNEKVLEIGGNIGRNALMIASILEKHDNNNFVTLESDREIAKQLVENRDLNNFHFFVEDSALSKRNIIQKGWDTIDSDVLLPEYKKVNSISLEKLKLKYNIEFDTLVLDCEGAFFLILMDMPEILNNINLIMMENDYYILEHKKYIDKILIENNFYVDYVESGGWGPCYTNFYEVWKKKIVRPPGRTIGRVELK